VSSSAAISPTGRRAAAAIAGIGWIALALQLAVTIDLMTASGHSVPVAVWRYLGFFTILTNLLVASTMTAVARSRWPCGSTPRPTATTGVVLAITVVGIVYEVLLSGRVPAMTPVWWTADRLLHYVVPVLTVAWWLIFVSKDGLNIRDPFLWLVYPVGYLAYAMVRGRFDGWYPYFFIDVAHIGYQQALTNAAALSAALLAAGYAVVGLVALTRRGRHV
jgi:hypothetical protein